MKSKGLVEKELKQKLADAFKSNNPDDITQAFADFAENVQQKRSGKILLPFLNSIVQDCARFVPLLHN
jgi:hypothetical protein